MAFFVPVLATLGGGSAVAGALAGASAVVGLMGAKAQYDAGQIAKAESKIAAKQEADAARGREIERKRDLLRALATQGAVAGAQGVGFAGSKAAIARTDIEQARTDTMTDRVTSVTKQRILRARGKSAAQIGTLKAVSSVLDIGQNLYGKFA